jgi:hypothetical protein
MSPYQKSLWTVFLVSFVSCPLSSANAGNYPEQLRGAWGGRAEYMGDDRSSVAKRACDSYRKNPKSVIGDLLVFGTNKKRSFGGYVL